jgi:hypothetical protein
LRPKVGEKFPLVYWKLPIAGKGGVGKVLKRIRAKG